MKVFVCTDLHGSRQALVDIDKHLKKHKYAAVFMLGDSCDRHDSKGFEYAEDFIDLVAHHKLPLYIVHGNNEPTEVVDLYQERDVSVHLKEKILDGYKIIGLGWGEAVFPSTDYVEGKILLTHEPPRPIALKAMSKKPYLPYAPLVHMSGHQHRVSRVYNFNPTVFVQVPAAQDGKAASLELPSRRVKFIDLP